MLLLRRLGMLAYRSVKGFFDDRCSQQAAAISYYVLFSIFPLMIFAVGLMGLVLQDEELQADVVDAIMENIPLSEDRGRDDVVEALDRVASAQGGAIGLVGLAVLAWSGSSMFGIVRSSLNQVFHVLTPRPIVTQKLLDLGVVLAFMPFFLGSVVATSALRLARTKSEDVHYLGDLPQNLGFAWWLASTALPIAISFVAFFLTYWLIPAKRLHAKYIVPGALLAAVLFEVVKVGFTIYLENFANYDIIFGSLGAVVAFLFWVYLSANIMLLGAEVSSELPDVMSGRYDEKRRGSGPQRTTRQKVLRFLRSLILRPKDDAPQPSLNPDEATPTSQN